LITQLLANGKRMPRVVRFINSLLEVTFVTLFVLAFAWVVDPIFAFTSPPTYLYLIFVLLTILQLDFALSVFTAVASAVAFVGTGLFEFARTTMVPNPIVLISPVPLLVKGIIFILGGTMAGFVARELRRRMVHAIETMEEKNRAIEMFGTHVSPKVADALLRSGGDFAGEQKFVCVMFLDIRNFTSFSERLPPQEVVAFLDVLFEPLVTIVNGHGGIVNKFLGDGFMAVFGAPVAEGQPCREAILAALEIVREVEQMVDDYKIPPTKIGIGLHAGEAITGTVGARSRKEYTVIGDTVNLASRIEQLTKKFGAQILASDAVWDNAQPMEIQVEVLEKTEVKGREAPVQVYKIA
jgi:adenylate cyclase